jgi:hypothetical protein
MTHKLYHIQAESMDGDLSLFVHATSVDEAFDLWVDYYNVNHPASEPANEEAYCRAVPTPTPGVSHAVWWDKMPVLQTREF